jgi:undecaprenyl diphosphate synthase
MVWETRQSSLYFTDTTWPDFDTRALARALAWFAQEDRPSGIQVGAQS